MAPDTTEQSRNHADRHPSQSVAQTRGNRDAGLGALISSVRLDFRRIQYLRGCWHFRETRLDPVGRLSRADGAKRVRECDPREKAWLTTLMAELQRLQPV